MSGIRIDNKLIKSLRDLELEMRGFADQLRVTAMEMERRLTVTEAKTGGPRLAVDNTGGDDAKV